MMRYWKLIPAIFFLVLLTACFPIFSNSTAPTSTPGKYDGQWEAHAITADGQEISLGFSVQGSAIKSLSYTYKTQAGKVCNFMILPGSLPNIVNDAFSAKISNVTIDGKFNSSSAALGNISFVEVNGMGSSNCVATVDAQWTASKKLEISNTTLPVTTAWCGKNVNCRDLLIQLMIFGLVNGAVLSLNAIGVTVIYSTVRTINLAHGDVFALTTVLITSSINIIGLNINWPASTQIFVLTGILIASILFGALLSLGVEEAAFRPFRGRSRLAPVIASLGISFILYQGSLIWRAYQKSFVRGEHRSVPGLNEVPTDGIPNFLPQGNLLSGKVVLQFGDVFVFVAAILFVVIATYLLLHTKLGRSIRSVAENEELAEIVGVNRDAAIRSAFVLGGALAGAAAFVFTLYYSRPFGQAGAESGLFAFAAALMGGVGSPGGALLSGLILGVSSSLSDYFLTGQWTPVLVLCLLIALLVWRRGGLTKSVEVDEASIRDSIVLTSTSESPKSRRWIILLFIAFTLYPLFSSKFNWGGEILIRGAGIFILLTLGLNILLGLAGVLDLSYATSFAIGAYAAAILTSHLRAIDFIIVLFLSASIGALFGLIKGLLAARMRGDYLAVGTLALGLMIQRAIINLDFMGGPNGFSNLPPPRLFGFSLAGVSPEYYLVFAIVVIAIFISTRLISSRTGRVWVAASENETAAISFGVNTVRYRLLAFVLSSAFAGIAGALYASTFSYVDPDIAAFHFSAMMLAMVILGGAGSIEGAVIGTILIYSYDKVLVGQLAAMIAMLWPQGLYLGTVPDIRGTNFFNFGIALYLTVLWRAKKNKSDQ